MNNNLNNYVNAQVMFSHTVHYAEILNPYGVFKLIFAYNEYFFF